MTQKKSILIIDDAPANLQLMTAALMADYQLQVAHSGAMGLRVAARVTPDLILLEVMMPEMDGFEVCRRIKADPELLHIPVIFLTGLGDFESEAMGLSLGAADYITKPIHVQTARHRIANLLEREQLRKEVEGYRDHLGKKVTARTLALSIAKEAAQTSQWAKTNFLNNMSHELRTPMTTIIGYTGLSLARATDPEQVKQLKKVSQASEQLLTLITNLMDMTALQSGQLRMESSTFKLGSILDGVAEQLSRQAATKGLEFNIKVDPALGQRSLQGDPLRLGQILQELTANAIKYTDHGRVEVEVEMLDRSNNDTQLRFTVRDSGIGIALADQKRIFKVFEQIDNSPNRQHGGTGVGLMLCKQLVELMGGTIGIDSTPGVGSTAWFILRLPKPAAAQ